MAKHLQNKKSSVILNKTSKEVEIKELIINNPEVYDFLSDKEKDKEGLVKWVEKAVIIGCAGLNQMNTRGNIDLVEKEFNRFLEKAKKNFEEQNTVINKKIDSTFDMKNTESPMHQMREMILEYFDSKKGKFKEMLGEYFDKENGQIKQVIDETFDLDDKKSAFSKLIEHIKENTDLTEEEIAELLDPNKTDSPAQLLREAIIKKVEEVEEKIKDLREGEIKDIRDKVLAEEATLAERERGTAKGLDFEEETYEELQNICRPYQDKITPVGRTTSSTGKKGDIIIDLDGKSKNRIVVECKNRKMTSCKDVNDEIRASLNNRKASFAIYLFSKKENMPSSFQPVKITEEYIITYMEKDNLHLAYRLARSLVIREKSQEDKIDFKKISSELNKIEDIIKNIDNMQAKATNVINSGTYLKEELEKLRSGIDLSLDVIKKRLSNKFDEKANEEDEDSTSEDEETDEEPEEEPEETRRDKVNKWKLL